MQTESQPGSGVLEAPTVPPPSEPRVSRGSWLLVGLVPVFIAAFAWRARTLGVGGDVPDAWGWYGPDRLADFLTSLGGQGRSLYAWTELLVDVPFAIVYGLLLRNLLVALWGAGSRRPAFAVGAAAFDVVENLLLASLAWTFAGAPSALARVASVFTLLKFGTLAVALILLYRACRHEGRSWGFVTLVWWSALVMMVSVAWPVLGALVLIIVIDSRGRFYLSEYAFFLRVPILLALALVLLPGFGAEQRSGAGSLIGNLFVLETPLGVFWVSLAATLLAVTLMWIARLVFLTQGGRSRLPFERASGSRAAPLTRTDVVGRNRRLAHEAAPQVRRLGPVLFALLALPFLAATYRLSVGPEGAQVEGTRAWWIAALVLGPTLSVTLAYVIRFLAPVDRLKGADVREEGLLRGFGGQGHLYMLAWAGVLAALYVVGGVMLEPSGGLLYEIPAMSFVLLIVGGIALVTALVALLVDVRRVPVLLAMLLVLFVVHRITGADYYYAVAPPPTDLPELPSARQTVRAWDDNNPSATYLTVVAASGGGIKASLWTARVLQALLSADFAPELRRSVVLVSSNSGGSVGSMFVTDAYRAGLPPTPEALDAAVDAAGRSSLSASLWGIAYRDFWRTLVGRPLGEKTHDRGWALDRSWESRRAALAGPRGQPASLGNWARDVARGLRPAHIFNAVAVESGAAFRFASVELPSPSRRRAPGSEPQEFWELYDGADVEVATAARLSASFPWVSPLARPWSEASDPDDEAAINTRAALRVADGGYFDNFGVFSAIEFLNGVGATYLDSLGVNGVLFVHIRASPLQDVPESEGGLDYDLIGPIVTMNNVRNAGQVTRNTLELRLLRERWADSVKVVEVAFDLCEAGPLSWHLSTREQERIRGAWGAREEGLLRGAIAELSAGAPPTARQSCAAPAASP
jgi:hypothetical protein